ncbi:MAG: recombinase family protein [Chloroflexota bacterium]|nr:MAG: recombinase family protein [Chloroflexota bacterium]
MRRLPAGVEDLRGLRAARWIRESTPGQFDRYGPEAQLALQDAAIRRLGLEDTGLVWRAAHSGRTVYRTSEMAAMLDAARAGRFDVLVVGYVSRWQRNLRRTLELLEDRLHPAGVAVWFADEEILSSCDRHWDQMVAEATDAERSSRRLSRRITEGYASKRASQRDPGGHPPFGFRRNPAKLLEPVPEQAPVVQHIYELATAGEPDRAIAEAVDLSLDIVRGILTSPLYAGQLRDGTPGHWEPLVPRSLWDQARDVRAQRATRTGRPADPRRPYALAALHCAACGARLTGDTGYYRHRDPCPAFIAARPPETRPRLGRSPGHAYRMELYEQIVEGLLAEASLAAPTLAAVVADLQAPAPGVMAADRDRIRRERDRAMARYLRDRDPDALERTMRRLDAEEAAPPEAPTDEAVPADVAVRYLGELPETWRRAEGGSGRAKLAGALFERIEVLGLQEATVHLSRHAVRHGLGAALPERLAVLVNGRGERI